MRFSHRFDDNDELFAPELRRYDRRMTAYIHGTESTEQERLATLNRITNRAFVDFLDVRPGMRVLEVGSGLGILATEVAAAAENVEVVGVERAAAQIAAAAQSSNVRYVHGDAHKLDFPDASFDLVYARYLLEHVADPETVLREMRRVARPGARVAVCENDINLMRIDPPCPTFDVVWTAFAKLQAGLGGDAYIGRRLFRLFRNAGFDDVVLSVQPELHWYGSPRFADWIRNLIGNVDGARQALTEARLCSDAVIDRAIEELIELTARMDASCLFVWNRAEAR